MRHDDFVSGVSWIVGLPLVDAAILSWSADHTARLWNAANGEELALVRHEWTVQGARWLANAPGGPAILSWSDREVRVSDPTTGQARTRIEHNEDEPINGVHWIVDAPDEPAIMTWTHDGPIRLWTMKGRECRRIEHNKLRGAHWVENAFDRAAVMSWAAFDTLRWWDPASGKERGSLRRRTWVSDAAWVAAAPGGPAILIWSESIIRLWDAATGHIRAQMEHSRDVEGAVWISDARGEPAILSWSFDQTIRLWSMAGKELARMNVNGPVSKVHWIDDAPSGPRILSWSIIGHEIQLWDARIGKLCARMGHNEYVQGAMWIADASIPAVLSWSADRTVRLWDAGTGAMITRFDLDAAPHAIAAKVAMLSGLEVAVGCMDGLIGIFEFDPGPWSGP